MSISAATTTRPPAAAAADSDVTMRDAADAVKSKPNHPSAAHARTPISTQAATTPQVPPAPAPARSPPREPAEMQLLSPMASSHAQVQQPPQQAPAPHPSASAGASKPQAAAGAAPQLAPQLLTLAQIDAKVAEAARSLQLRFAGGCALFVDPFEGRPVRVSMHANQRNWRTKRITKNGRSLLAHESRLRGLADAKTRHANEEAAAVAALEAIRKDRQNSDDKTQALAREHARIARSTGLLKLCSMIDGLYSQQQQSHVAEKTRKRARLQELRAEYTAKRARLAMADHAATIATDAHTVLPVAAAPVIQMK